MMKGKKLSIQTSTSNWNQTSIENEQLNSFLTRQNSLLESLIQIYKQFLKLNSTSHEGQTELNKKLCIIESIKFYVEHLMLFHKFEMLLVPRPVLTERAGGDDDDDVDSTPHNYISEMQINFKIIENRWIKRRQEQFELLNAINSSSSGGNPQQDIIYPFTYLIDCLFEECRGYSNVAKLFAKSDDQKEVQSQRDVIVGYGYPPKSLIVRRFFLTTYKEYEDL